MNSDYSSSGPTAGEAHSVWRRRYRWRIRALLGLLLFSVAPTTGCDDYSRDPNYLLQGGLEGGWTLNRRNAEGGPIPEGFSAFELQMGDASSDGIDKGFLTDSLGRQHHFELGEGGIPLYGPWLELSETQTGRGWQDRIWLGVEARKDPADDTLLLAFEIADDGCVYPHSFERDSR